MSKIKECSSCEQEFTAKHGGRKYCSDECIRAGKKAHSKKARKVNHSKQLVSESKVVKPVVIDDSTERQRRAAEVRAYNRRPLKVIRLKYKGVNGSEDE